MTELVIDFLSEELSKFHGTHLATSASVFLTMLTRLTSSRTNKPKKTTNSEMKFVALLFI